MFSDDNKIKLKSLTKVSGKSSTIWKPNSIPVNNPQVKKKIKEKF